MMKRFAALIAVCVLAACTEGPLNSHAPDLTFDNLQPLQVAVGQVEIINKYQPPMKGANVEHTFRTPPSVAAENLVRQKVIATGGMNTMRVIIEDASVLREELPVEKGWTDLLRKEPAEKLKARVLLRFEMVSPSAPDIVIGRAEVVATREKTLMEDISPATRDQEHYAMTKSLMDDLSQGMRTSVRNTFGGF